MGGIFGYFSSSSISEQPDSVTGLTPKQKFLVQSSWQLLKKNVVGNGTELFMTFFRRFPQYHQAFPFRDVPSEELPNNNKFRGHVTNVMYALSAIADNINDTDILINLLEKNGETHARRKIDAQSFWDLKPCALDMLQKALGSKFTAETKEAWDKTLTVAFTVLIKSFEEHRKQ